MFGWRARIGVLLPPGNPTVEPELCGMAPTGVSVHFARMEAPPSLGPAGGAAGMEERTRAYREGLEGPARALGEGEQKQQVWFGGVTHRVLGAGVVGDVAGIYALAAQPQRAQDHRLEKRVGSLALGCA